MSREIKFRAWDRETKRMCVVDCLTNEGAHLIGTGSKEEWETNADSRSYTQKPANQDFRKFKKIELMQFTGLKDKNGKEIYEGDIWEAKYNGLGKFVVKFEVGAFNLCRYRNDDGVVIGNIYESPELLK